MEDIEFVERAQIAVQTFIQGDNLRMHALVTVYHVNKQL